MSQSFGDLLKTLDAAFFVSGLVRSGRLVAIGDVSHTSASREGRVPVPGGPLVPAEGRLRQTSLTALGGVRAVDQPALTVDFLAGLRTIWLETTVEAPALGIQKSPKTVIVDPLFAVRVNGRMAEGWSLLLYGDFGGLGAGSEFTTQFVGTISHQVARRVWLSAGYRRLALDYRGQASLADIAIAGPLLGATVAF